MKRGEKLFAIGEAAEFLDVSIDTLRRWDRSGKLRAMKSAGGHRYYSREQLEEFVLDIRAIAYTWAESKVAPDLPSEYYCGTQDVFKARLDSVATALDSDPNTKSIASLVAAMAGEIGNNSFDHNLGNWPDMPGVFFVNDTGRRFVILADRGLGIRATLLRVRPGLKDDLEAIKVAFTEHVSGRAPEQRGNGLKFVKGVAIRNPIGVSLQSGIAVAQIAKKNGKLKINLADRNIRGTLAEISY